MDQAKKIELAQFELFENNNAVLAERLLLEIAEQGNGHACHELGVLYSMDQNALKANKEKSVYWLNKSVELGFEKTIATDTSWFKGNAN